MDNWSDMWERIVQRGQKDVTLVARIRETFSVDEQARLLAIAQRFGGQDGQLRQTFSDKEIACMEFMRWLVESGRLEGDGYQKAESVA